MWRTAEVSVTGNSYAGVGREIAGRIALLARIRDVGQVDHLSLVRQGRHERLQLPSAGVICNEFNISALADTERHRIDVDRLGQRVAVGMRHRQTMPGESEDLGVCRAAVDQPQTNTLALADYERCRGWVRLAVDGEGVEGRARGRGAHSAAVAHHPSTHSSHAPGG